MDVRNWAGGVTNSVENLENHYYVVKLAQLLFHRRFPFYFFSKLEVLLQKVEKQFVATQFHVKASVCKAPGSVSNE